MCTASNQKAFQWHDRFVQQARWTAELRRCLLERLGYSQARRVLEVGCGTGAILISLAQQSASGARRFGLDIDRAYLSLAARHAPSALLAQGDAHQLPYACASFDIVLCHFLLLWVNDPQQVVGEMARVARRGGWVLAFAEPDYGGRVDYPEVLAELGARQEAALSRQGAHTRLGRRLSALFHAAGLQQVETGVLSGQWRGAPNPQEWESEWDVLETDLAGEVSPDDLTRLKRLDADAWQRGERTLFVPTFYALGQVS
jgi:SAM-dependent methyltransferase